MYKDQDGDGVVLIDDLDPDGNDLDIFSDPDADNDGVPNSAVRRLRTLDEKYPI